MKIIARRSELIEAITFCTSFQSKQKEYPVISRFIHLTQYGDEILTFTATNGEMVAEYNLMVRLIDGGGSYLINGDKVKRFLAYVDDDLVNINITQEFTEINSLIHIANGRVWDWSDNWFINAKEDDVETEPLLFPNKFFSQKWENFIGDDYLRAALKGVNVECGVKGLFAVATNAHKLKAMFFDVESQVDRQFNIPILVIKQIRKVLSKKSVLFESKVYVSLRKRTTIIRAGRCRIEYVSCDHVFPKWRMVIEKQKFAVSFEPKDMLRAIKICNITSNPCTRSGVLGIGKELVLSSDDMDTNEKASVTIPHDNSFSHINRADVKFCIGFNLNLLSCAVNELSGGRIFMCYTRGTRGVTLYNKLCDNIILIMPMKINEDFSEGENIMHLPGYYEINDNLKKYNDGKTS